MKTSQKKRIRGEEAVALGARHGAVELATGLRGTYSSEMLDAFRKLGGTARWSKNEGEALKRALETASKGARTVTVLKHPDLTMFSKAAFKDGGALVVISAETLKTSFKPGGNPCPAAAQIPLLEPADPQDAYDFTLAALEISARWRVPVLLNITPGVCRRQTDVHPKATNTSAVGRTHSGGASRLRETAQAKEEAGAFGQKLEDIRLWNESCALNQIITGGKLLGIITSGACFLHAREAAPEASVFKIGLTHPLPLKTVARFAKGVVRCVVLEEGEPYLVETIRAAGIRIEGKPEMYRFGKLDAARICRILNYDLTPEYPQTPGIVTRRGMPSTREYTQEQSGQ